MSLSLSIQELLNLPAEEAQKILAEFCKESSDNQLAEEWSVRIGFIKKLRHILGVHRSKRGDVTGVGEIQYDFWPPRYRLARVRTADDQQEEGAYQEANQPEAKKQGLYLTFNGEFQGEELKNRLETLGALAGSKGDATYLVNIIIEEKDS